MLFVVCNRPNERLRDVDALTAADACRAAGLAFVNGVRKGWGKAELAAWLVGEYARATGFVGKRFASLDAEARDDSGAGRTRTVEEIMREASVAVMRALDEAKGPREPAFVNRAKETMAIASVRTTDGVVWAPLDVAGMRLKNRILALFAVDYLARPKDYLFEICPCPVCGRISLDATAEDSVCDAHRNEAPAQDSAPVSGVREPVRRKRTTTPPASYATRQNAFSMGMQSTPPSYGPRRCSTLSMGVTRISDEEVASSR